MALKLIESTQVHQPTVNEPHLGLLVRAGLGFERDQLLDRPISGGDQEVTWHTDPQVTDEFDRHAQ